MPIVKKDDEREAVLSAARGLHSAAESAGLRVRLDADEGRTPGWKFHFWEMKVAAHRVGVNTAGVCATNSMLAPGWVLLRPPCGLLHGGQKQGCAAAQSCHCHAKYSLAIQ